MGSGIHRLKPGHLKKRGPAKLCDGGGLWLYVTANNARRWVFRYRLNGKDYEIGLGGLKDVSIQEARELAAKLRNIKHQGENPRNHRPAYQRMSVWTFDRCAAVYIEAHAPGWKNPKHCQQWENTLKEYASPVIGNMRVEHIETHHVLQVIEPIWATKTETATRLRQRIEAIIAWAIARKYRPGPNPAQWRGHLDKLLPAPAKVKKSRRQPAMPYKDVPGFLLELSERRGTSARALEILVLTALRTREVAEATWDEIDFDKGVWTIPGERMKTGKTHRVPLSKQVRSILNNLPTDQKYIFPAPRNPSSPLSNQALLVLMRKMGYGNKGQRGPWVPHGFRATFRSWCADQTTFPREIAEQALAHTIKGVEGVYQRSDLLERRRELMQAWADFCQPL